MREDTKLWGPRVFQRGMGATLLSHGNGEDKTGDSRWLLFAASIRGVDVSWQAVGKSTQPPNVTSLPPCLAHSLPLPAGCLAGRETALLVCPGAVRVGSGFGCWGAVSQARAGGTAALPWASACSWALRWGKGLVLPTHPPRGSWPVPSAGHCMGCSDTPIPSFPAF